jgi:hypothetical protein
MSVTPCRTYEDCSQLLRLLAEQGNRALAQSRFSELVPREWAPALWQELAQHRVLSGQILAPLIDPVESGWSLACGVEVGEDCAPPPYLDEQASSVVREAIEEAWRLVGGPGPCPPATIRVPLAAAMGFRIQGRSLFLPTLLAATARFGEAVPMGNVLATGDFAVPIDFLRDKQALAAAVRDELGQERLLVASRTRAPLDPDLATACTDGVDALRQSFHLLPWHPEAEVRRVHVYCADSKRNPPLRFAGKDTQPIDLPARLEPQHLDEAVARVCEALGAHPRAELSIAGPVALAARLGWELKNRPTCVVRIIDCARNEPWWHNQARAPFGPQSAASPEPRVLVGTATSIPPGWDLFPIPQVLTARDIPPLVRRFLETYATAKDLHLAVAGPVALAWALGAALKNRVPFTFYQREGAEYRAWFSG